ncbi:MULTISPECIES: LPXTG cell wall anchor domain-containing protein [unclassified Enterococcus]|uniref:LPXTG cell wall anchor domain-containing protein n=1 Tax=unclassified Enterococcus TaxID=2608891 RepID=UPI0019061951|nr:MULTISPECIES: LPXTG cell wall anchor domain-containing protein [unclassified Enterococcus]MBK0039233.1 LPXTG cell wall anchor domain-containing protein [Enterococcus sp. S52]MBK0071881.1 LPXTG cell wall anchor domain-containing protein [Enterococcus sp. S53]MBK0142473.1 LPXTG cell wall anchor domain-containing protein [Enterococcus sp. S76]MBK0146168.1 LPXTG cell wall anchor domain-containing protein [Enterococcus sp. S77]
MKHIKRCILNIGILLLQVYTPLVVYGTEVCSVKTDGTIGFTGVYETPGLPEPAPEGEVRPDFPHEIAQHPSEVRHITSKNLPKTNEKKMNIWIIFGTLIVIATLVFWKYKKKKIHEESRI